MHGHSDHCFHCGLDIPAGSTFFTEIGGEKRQMCCAGCEAVAAAIVSAGLSDYYKHRTAQPMSPNDKVFDELEKLRVYDHKEIQSSFVTERADNTKEADLILEGIQCAACVWLNERHIQSQPGVVEVSVNYSNHQARVVWDDSVIHLSEILASINAIGYNAHPFDPDRQRQLGERQHKDLLKKIGVAAALGMQVMILAVALYNGDWYGMDEGIERFFRHFSLLLTLPVMIYSGREFFKNAWIDLKMRRVSMDVPVALGIGLAFTASTWNVITGHGTIYFESVCMFILFLLGARYFELKSRLAAMSAAQSIGYVRPMMATRVLDGGDSPESVAAIDLEPGDIILVKPGEVIPADGEVADGRSGVDESILTGESEPVIKSVGDRAIGGSLNTESPLRIRVSHSSRSSTLSEINRLLNRALSGKPSIGRFANRIAGFFVAGVLAIATIVSLYWWSQGNPDWLQITIAVLVVSCPCALSLAVPAAISSAISNLMREHILITREHVLETLPQTTLFVFDKTGTLTEGHPEIVEQLDLRGDTGKNLAIAVALEQMSEHPIAGAFLRRGSSVKTLQVKNGINYPGSGIEGEIDTNRYYIGNLSFIRKHTDNKVDSPEIEGTSVYLADDTGVVAMFRLADPVRAESKPLISALNAAGYKTALLSGDNHQAARQVGESLGVGAIVAESDPEMKLAQVREWQSRGEVVSMVGDGVNDTPVLAGADVSISVAGATPAAVASADAAILAGNLATVEKLLNGSRKTMKIIRQNLGWAILYNSLAIPFAAAGLVPPWLAALGMSLSSIIVVANASRLRKT